jgi:hypothetical protein
MDGGCSNRPGPLLIRVEEAAEAGDDVAQGATLGQERQTHVIRTLPVEGAAVHDQDVLGPEEVQHELLVVDDRVLLGIQTGEDVERTTGLVYRDPGIARSAATVAFIWSCSRPPGTRSPLRLSSCRSAAVIACWEGTEAHMRIEASRRSPPRYPSVGLNPVAATHAARNPATRCVLDRPAKVSTG